MFRFWWYLLIESCRQAGQQLIANRLRTILSLIGVAIGIFCIISVFAAVDSLEREIRSSFEKLGNNVLYITKMPWTENPAENYYKYLRRPDPDYDDYLGLKQRMRKAELIAYSHFIGPRTVKFGTNAVNGAFLIAATNEYAPVLNINFESGRFFSSFEASQASDCVVIGYEVAQTLFGPNEAVGRYVHLAGRKMLVIGVIEQAGDDLINPMNYDWCVIVTYQSGKRYANLNSPFNNASSLMILAKPDVALEKLMDEVTVNLRAIRRQRPIDESSFSINSLSAFSMILDQFFSFLNLLGIVIGGFALIVGAFSVANIMFVSVRERTGQIGIKKALGAKSGVILLEFLIEATVLCVIGGVIGLLLVYGVMLLLTSFIDNFTFLLSMKNIVYGLIVAVAIGIAAGIVPAFMAARMDPVAAMRS